MKLGNFETRKIAAEQTGAKINAHIRSGATTTSKAACFVGNKVKAGAQSAAGTVYGFVRGLIGKAESIKMIEKKD